MESAPKERTARTAVFSAVALYVTFSAYIVTLPKEALLAHSFADDAFYYLRIAARFGEARWPTFDGEHVTSGFHPLWLGVLVGLAKVVRDPMLLGRAAIALSSALLLAACWIFGRTVKRLAGAELAAGVTVFLLGAVGVARIGLLGMESPLALLMLAAFLHELHAGRRRAAILGARAGLAVHARLDSVLALGAATLVDLRYRRELRLHVASSAVAAVVASPFFAWTYAATGHLSTVSAATKSLVTRMNADAAYGGPATLGYVRWVAASLAHQASSVGRALFGGVVQGATSLLVGDYPTEHDLASRHVPAFAASAGIVALAFVLSEKVWRPRSLPLDPRCRALFLSWALGAALHFVIVGCKIPGQADRWYWVTEAVGAAAILAWYAARSASGARLLGTAAWAGAISMVALTAAGLHGRANALRDRPAFLQTMAQLADTVSARVPERVPRPLVEDSLVAAFVGRAPRLGAVGTERAGAHRRLARVTRRE
jgi:hypothetical protein